MRLPDDLLRLKLDEAMAATLAGHTRRDIEFPSIAGEVMALTGVRGSGKTSLLEQRAADRVTKRSPREAHLLVSLEDERLAGMTAADLEWLIEEHGRVTNVRENTVVSLYLDEVQRVAGWDVLVRRLLESRRFEVFIAGSTSELTSPVPWLSARSIEIPVHPFSFREALRYAGAEPSGEWAELSPEARADLDQALAGYLEAGGLPQVQGQATPARNRWLANVVDVVLLRDLIEPYNVTNPAALRWLHRQLMANAAGGFTLRNLHENIRELNIPIGRDLLYAYLAYLEEACLVRTISMRSDSERQQMVNPRKVYPIDPALIGLFETSSAARRERAFLATVFLELDRRGYFVQWMRTDEGIDVDFFAEHDSAPPLVIQARLAADIESWDRDVRGLETVAAADTDARSIVITLDSTPPARRLSEGVVWRPLTQWLLE